MLLKRLTPNKFAKIFNTRKQSDYNQKISQKKISQKEAPLWLIEYFFSKTKVIVINYTTFAQLKNLLEHSCTWSLEFMKIHHSVNCSFLHILKTSQTSNGKGNKAFRIE